MDMIYELGADKVQVNDRTIQWIVSAKSGIQSALFSCCVVEFPPGTSARPPHSHSDCEEAIYVLSGLGEARMEGGAAYPIKAGSFLLMRVNEIHMLRNTGREIMKVICYYSAPTENDKYKLHPMEAIGCEEDV